MAGPQFTLRWIAADLPNRVDYGIGGLDTPGLLELPQKVPSRQENELIGVHNDHPFGIAVIAQQQRPFVNAE